MTQENESTNAVRVEGILRGRKCLQERTSANPAEATWLKPTQSAE